MKTIHVVAAIIKDGNKIFATQRGYGEFKDGWEFPGGKVEPNETSKQAIVREIKEELDTTFKYKNTLIQSNTTIQTSTYPWTASFVQSLKET